MIAELQVFILLVAMGFLLIPFVKIRLKRSSAELFFISALLSYSLVILSLWILSSIFGFSVYAAMASIAIVFALNIPYIGNFIGCLKLPKVACKSLIPYALPVLIMALFFMQRSTNPASGMDLWHNAVVNSIISNGAVPPANPWFSGTSLAYPYGYHIFSASLSTLSGVPVEIVLNVIMPYFAFLMVLGIYVVVYRLSKRMLAGLAASVFSVSGSLIGVLLLAYLMAGHPFNGQLSFSLGTLPLPFDASSLPITADTSGVVSGNVLNTNINAQFPLIYFNSIESMPFSFAFFMFCTLLFFDAFKARKWKDLVVPAVSFSVLGIIYPFDYVTLFGAALLCMAANAYLSWRIRWRDVKNTTLVLLGSLVVFVPYLLSISTGIMWIPYLQTLAWGVYALYYGPMLIFFLLGLVYLHKSGKFREENWIFILSIFATAMFFANTIFPSNMFDSYHKFLVLSWFPVAIIAAMGLKASVCFAAKRLRTLKGPAYGLITLLVMIGLLPTMLSFAFQYGAIKLVDGKTVTENIADFQPQPQMRGFEADLNPLFWMQQYYPDEYSALVWVGQNTPRNSIFIEAYYDRYKMEPLVPAVSGRIVVLGWYSHMRQYGYSKSEISQRMTDIDAIYNSTDCAAKTGLVEKYGASYVWVGYTETERYPADGIAAFDACFTEVFSSDHVKIFRA